ncbi:alpha-amylase family protein [Pseudoroseicyclus tamaricis]|uniref:Alpha-amylase n=1 Tax=Pseudoroseicyclus tamaricis TaxID=2705421 RepID=A0A6B2JPJ7_9RHOB|nr:alpha-amylase family protein [Pseudoroseicyclus tamaricis]NDU99874.1 trehalose synthase [Pseudoroseicyclus tamaricis]
MIDLWYKNAVIYCLDIETFRDGNGDGVGDFSGAIETLDYLEALGVNVIWLNPFYPTPNRDNGYDISDFYGVDTRLGHLGDFVEFMQGARNRGIRVIIDLVVNHTSIDHPWFQSACESATSPYRDWYVWSKEKPKDISEGIIFPGVQDAVWTYSRKAQAWYMHRFYAHQADLNIANPKVREEILKIMGFWLALGVSGFRIDAVPFLVEFKGLKEEPDRDPLLLLSEMRDFLDWRSQGAVMLAEANVPRETAPDYFGGRVHDADERMHMLFDFPLNQDMWLGFVRKSAAPVIEALKSRPPELPDGGQWATFLRNHDELSLDKLTKEEQQEAFAALAPEEGMKIYGRGVRRRLAPMLGGDTARVALAQALLFGLPGTPVLWYGDEIGMGEDLSLDERWSVRTPMQWSGEPNGGFSAAEGELPVPVISSGAYGYRTINVEEQERTPRSLLRRVQGMVRARRCCPEIGAGQWSLIEGLPETVLGLDYRLGQRRLLVLANFGEGAVELSLEPGRAKVELAADDQAGPTIELEGLIMAPHDYLWLRPRAV